MTTMKILTPVALLAALALAADPAQAQQRRGGGGQRDGGGQRSAPRGTVSRGGSGGGPTRSVARSRAYPVYRGGVRPGYRGSVRVAPRIISPRGVYVGRGPHFYRPYYSFRPRVSVGFGLWLGYPVTYPYYYGSPYGYAYPYPPDPYGYGYGAYGYGAPSYGYPARPYVSANQSPAYPPQSGDPDYGPSGQGYQAQPSAPSVGVQRGDETHDGGVSFEITPDTAAVFVDGTYVGTVGDFSPTSQPLGLVSGRHRIEIRASGYRTMTFDTDITSGQILPYQGALQRD